MGSQNNSQMKVVPGEFGYVLQDVPHFSDYISDLKVIHLFVFAFVCVVHQRVDSRRAVVLLWS